MSLLYSIKVNNFFFFYSFYTWFLKLFSSLDIIQHPQSSVVTLPATILTATVAGTAGPGMHSGPMQSTEHTQVINITFSHDLNNLYFPPLIDDTYL